MPLTASILVLSKGLKTSSLFFLKPRPEEFDNSNSVKTQLGLPFNCVIADFFYACPAFLNFVYEKSVVFFWIVWGCC